MPAQSGDPVATAIHTSLVSVKKCSNKTMTTGSTARLVLSSEVKYERSPSLDSTAVLGQLKSKYIVLSPAAPMGSTNGRLTDEASVKKVSKCSGAPLAAPAVHSKDNSSTSKRVLYPPESVQLGWKGSTPVGSGFINLGNTCYLNSTLQVSTRHFYSRLCQFRCSTISILL
ncbi:hypothetical protein AAG570_013937 [Ranatra chinensis]|uniref:USP domain-containing protein n=1 Tax=Ranatra chinensis TaxID=642074 RepID=A0ABD0YDN1_9HEMI